MEMIMQKTYNTHFFFDIYDTSEYIHYMQILTFQFTQRVSYALCVGCSFLVFDAYWLLFTSGPLSYMDFHPWVDDWNL